MLGDTRQRVDRFQYSIFKYRFEGLSHQITAPLV
jgi:hypothetical protein